MKYIRVKDESYTWVFPAKWVAENRASYYANHDESTTFEEEYDFVINDDTELFDWFLNNMDWEDVSSYARLEKQPFKLKPDLFNSDLEVFEKEV